MLASEHRIALVPQGGNTGLVGARPRTMRGGDSMRRMTKFATSTPRPTP